MATIAPAYAPRAASAARTRLDSIDWLRGMVMVIMVIDHTRDFVHGPALHDDPTDLTRTSAAIFMTRWITRGIWLLFVGVGMIALHNTLDGIMSQSLWWMVLHRAGFVMVPSTSLGAGGTLVWVQYPLVPWIGVMAAGYAFGALYELEVGRRIRIIARLGLALTAAFIIVRTVNVYGDPSHWSVQPSALFWDPRSLLSRCLGRVGRVGRAARS